MSLYLGSRPRLGTNSIPTSLKKTPLLRHRCRKRHLWVAPTVTNNPNTRARRLSHESRETAGNGGRKRRG